MLRVVCATSNPHKVVEIVGLMSGTIELIARPASLPITPETESSLVGNARLKAIAVVQATGLPAIADDTGLEVDALDGAPGVLSARFAGIDATDTDNITKLLSLLGDAAQKNRNARFRTVIILLWPDGREIVCQGECQGMIATEKRGSNGFGYDSVFIPLQGQGQTFAEMDIASKQEISHRGQAFRNLTKILSELPTA